MSTLTICECLQEILDEAVDALVDCELPVPECRFINIGRPAVDDCPLLVVWLESARRPNNSQAACKGPLLWRINIGYWSCWPVVDENGNLPDCDELTECSCEHLCVVEALLASICDSASSCGELNDIELRSQDPSGGCVGTIITATIRR